MKQISTPLLLSIFLSSIIILPLFHLYLLFIIMHLEKWLHKLGFKINR